MLTPYDTKLPPHLQALKEEIEGYASDYGLDFFETIFEVIDADDLNEVAAYGGFPTRYPHWSFGMAYEELRKGYDYGLSKIYEMVINNDPCYAYLMRSNHVVDQKLVMAHVYGHCLAPETLIEVRDGVKRITDVQEGDEVLTHRGEYRRVRACASRPYKGKIYKIKVAGSNEEVRITGEHPVYVLRPKPCVLMGRERVPCRPSCKIQHKCSAPRPYIKYKLDWIPASDVRVGDVVVFPKTKKECRSRTDAVEIPFDKVLHRQHLVGTHQLRLDEKLAKFLGYFIAEGSALTRGLVSLGFHQLEHEYHNETTSLIEQVFQANAGRDDSPSTNATTIRFNSLEIAHWLREVVGTHSKNKRIPAFLFNHPKSELLRACLQGMFAGDGYYTSATNRSSGQLSYTTISQVLAYQLRHVGLRWDLHSQIYSRQRPKRQRSYEVVWSGKSGHKLSQLLLGTDVVPGNRTFERNWTDDDYLYRHVRSVETEDYDGRVYNFSVEEDESYTLAAGFVVHNCDFFKNNAYFAHTNRKMMDEMANHGARIRRYVEKYGEDEVEGFIDRCMSIDDLIDRHAPGIKRHPDSTRYDFTPESEKDDTPQATRFKSKAYMDDYINPPKILKQEQDDLKKQLEGEAGSFPQRPEKDVLLFLINYAPLKGWQRDVLSIIRDEAYYFAPQGQTKIINEGWACAVYDTLIYTDEGLLPLGEVVDRQLPVRVGDGESTQRVYDWAKFDDRETVWMRTKRGLELEASVTHRLRLPDGTWRRMDELNVGDRLLVSGGRELWPSEYAECDEASLSGDESAMATLVCVDERVALSLGQRLRRSTHVPEVIMRSHRSVVVAFLNGLRGCSDCDEKIDEGIWICSEEIGKTVQLLLLNCGILSSRRQRPDGTWEVCTERTHNEHWQDEVVALERRRANVYDISVERTHRYAAAGFVNHNSYWHSTMMTQKVLQPSEVLDYAEHHSGTMAMSGGRLNPYKVGIELLRDIEDRWNRGRFGKEYEECDDLDRKRNWNKDLGLGREKIFEVRRVHNDITFIDAFLTPEFCVEHNLFSFAYHEQAGQYYIESRDFEKIKQRLLYSLTNFGKPWIYVVDGNYRNRGELLLRHEYNGTELRLDLAAETLTNIQFVWGRPVHIHTIVDDTPTMLTYDGSEHDIRTGGDIDDPRDDDS